MSGSSQPSLGMAAVLTVAFLAELAMLAGLAVVGAALGDGAVGSVALAVALPGLAGVVWGLALAPRARFNLPQPVRIAGKVVLLLGTAVALAAVGYVLAGVLLGVFGVGSTLVAFFGAGQPTARSR